MSRFYFLPRTLAPLLLLLLLSACSFSLAEDITPPPGAEIPAEMPSQPPPSGPLYPLISPNPAEGALIYTDKCAPCHGPSGLGDGPQASQLPNPPAALAALEVARQSTPAEWYSLVTQGNLDRFMPPFNSLSDRQRWNVVAYLYTLSIPQETLAQGQELYKANCASCHGLQGSGDGSEAASLQVAPTNFTDQERMASRSPTQLFEAISAGIAPAMPTFDTKLTEDERWALAAYLRSLTFASPAEIARSQETPVPLTTSEAGSTGTPLASATEVENGTITGQVVNASGGDVPADMTIDLYGFDEMRQTYTATTTIDPDGSYTFLDVEMPVGRAFITSTEYNKVAYSSDIAVVEAGTTKLDLSIPIRETTTDSSVLSVDRMHILFEYGDPDTLRVIELWILSNLSDRTLVATEEGAPVVTYRLPEGATNLQFEDGVLGERYMETPGGFGDTDVLRPGPGLRQLVFSFEMPYRSRLEFVQPIDLPVNAVVILGPEEGVNVKSTQLQDAGTRQMQDISYHMYTSDRLEAGSELAMTISGRPKGTSLVAGSSTNLVIGLLAFGIALIVAGAWLFRRNRAERTGIEAAEELDEELLPGEAAEDPETLLDAILALDDQYRAGELPEEAYRQRRSELKAHLKDMLGS